MQLLQAPQLSGSISHAHYQTDGEYSGNDDDECVHEAVGQPKEGACDNVQRSEQKTASKSYNRYERFSLGITMASESMPTNHSILKGRSCNGKVP